jgi:hypothetical protein
MSASTSGRSPSYIGCHTEYANSSITSGLLDTAVEPLKNPVSGAEHRARIDLPMGKEFRMAEVASGTTKATGVIPLYFANSHAHFADSTFTSGGLQA